MTDAGGRTSAAHDVAEVAAALQHTVGRVYSVAVRRVEPSAVAAFVAATGEPNPIYSSKESARQGPWGEVVAPPLFLATIRSREPARIDFGYGSHAVLGGSVLEIVGPIRMGDVIVAVETVASIRGKTGRSGPMLIVETATEYCNEHGLIGRGSTTIIRRS